ncbi:hypothetical protein B0A55_03738 [Friedmanniomyces simplex]|uniref:Uncharacterized protein n=1 Tax=Friedmanniomyces simplex TaxID=329884 RepID=A0A4U0XJ47_9PEZI|nr:hypothetical protein B0A55_03738 [Friedmanniomyces simplex]
MDVGLQGKFTEQPSVEVMLTVHEAFMQPTSHSQWPMPSGPPQQQNHSYTAASTDLHAYPNFPAAPTDPYAYPNLQSQPYYAPGQTQTSQYGQNSLQYPSAPAPASSTTSSYGGQSSSSFYHPLTNGNVNGGRFRPASHQAYQAPQQKQTFQHGHYILQYPSAPSSASPAPSSYAGQSALSTYQPTASGGVNGGRFFQGGSSNFSMGQISSGHANTHNGLVRTRMPGSMVPQAPVPTTQLIRAGAPRATVSRQTYFNAPSQGQQMMMSNTSVATAPSAVMPAMGTVNGQTLINPLAHGQQTMTSNNSTAAISGAALPLAVPNMVPANPLWPMLFTNPVIPTAVTIHPLGPPPATITTTTLAVRTATHQTDLTNHNSVNERTSLPHCLMSLPDMLFGMPHSTQHPEVIIRALSNGWTTQLIAATTLYARGIVDAGVIKRRGNALRKQVPTAGKQLHPNKADWSPTTYPADMAPVTVYNATNYAPRTHIAHRMQVRTLEDIGKGWINFPAVQDCGFLTMAVLHARQLGNTTWTTADVPWLAQTNGWTLPADVHTTQWDQRARARVIAALRAVGVRI